MSDATHPPDDPVELNNARIFVWVTVTLVLVLSILSFAARIWARKKLRQPLLADDWFMALGLLISFLPAACIYLCMLRDSSQSLRRTRSSNHKLFVSFIQWSRSPYLECSTRSTAALPEGMYMCSHLYVSLLTLFSSPSRYSEPMRHHYSPLKPRSCSSTCVSSPHRSSKEPRG